MAAFPTVKTKAYLMRVSTRALNIGAATGSENLGGLIMTHQTTEPYSDMPRLFYSDLSRSS